MTIEVEVRRPRRVPNTPLNITHQDQVLTFGEWCQINRLSERTGRRIIAAPDGPTTVQLSARRIGITVRANRESQQSRARARA
jgi:hypothetical protein